MKGEYTAIYVESWMAGSHQHSLTRMQRLSLKHGESVGQMLERAGIADNTVFLFHGHPKLQGE